MAGNILSKLAIGILSAGMAMASFLLASIGALLFGSVYSVGAVGISLLTRQLFPPSAYSRLYPKFSFMVNAGSAMSLPLIGYLYDFTHSYMPALYIAIFIDAVNIISLAIQNHVRTKKAVRTVRL